MIRKLKSGKYRLYSRKVDPKSLRHSHRGQSLLAAKPFPLFATVVILIVIGAGAGFLLRTLKKRKSGGVL